MVLVRVQLYPGYYPERIVVEIEQNGRTVEEITMPYSDEDDAIEYIIEAVRKAVKEDISVFGKRDLVEIRNRIAKKLSECQDSNNIGGRDDHQV